MKVRFSLHESQGIHLLDDHEDPVRIYSIHQMHFSLNGEICELFFFKNDDEICEIIYSILSCAVLPKKIEFSEGKKGFYFGLKSPST